MNKGKKRNLWIVLGVVVIVILALIIIFSSNNSRQKDTIKIGAILPLTGVDASNGNSARDGLIMAQEEININGGIEGKKIELFFEDSKGDSKEAISAYQKLVSMNDIQVIFTLGSPVALSLSSLVNKDNILLFAIASTPAYSSPNDYTFRVVPSAVQEGVQTAEFIYNTLGIKSLGLVYLNNEYGVGTKNNFVKEYTKLGGKIIIEESFNQEDYDMKTQIRKIKQAGVKNVYLSSWGKQAGLFIKEAEELDLENVSYFCTQACLNNDLINEGGSSVEGVIFPFAYIREDSEFFYEYKLKYNKEPIQFSERMYDSLKLSSKLIQVCGINNTCSKENINTLNFSGVSADYQFDINGDIIDKLAWYTVQDGEFRLYNISK